jgi:hypothetical protein
MFGLDSLNEPLAWSVGIFEVDPFPWLPVFAHTPST